MSFIYDRSDGTSGRWKRASVMSVLLAITGAAPFRFGAVATSQGIDAGAERAQRLEAMEALARSVAVTEVANGGGGRTPAAMRPKPLHRWNEPTRRGGCEAGAGHGVADQRAGEGDSGGYEERLAGNVGCGLDDKGLTLPCGVQKSRAEVPSYASLRRLYDIAIIHHPITPVLPRYR
jgi:hypothetical protein